jgi:hypothetical protein
MKLSFSIATLATVCLLSTVNGFATPVARTQSVSVGVVSPVFMTTMAESGVPPATSDASEVADVEIPFNLPSDCGMDYVPLATMLATGQLAEADQVSQVELELELFWEGVDRSYLSVVGDPVPFDSSYLSILLVYSRCPHYHFRRQGKGT